MEVKIFDNVLPVKTNLDILKLLGNEKNWEIATDLEEIDRFTTIISNPTGFLFKIIEDKITYRENSKLLLYSNIVLDFVCQELKFKEIEVDRIFWNLYTPLAFPRTHVDSHSDKHFSIIYNPHTTDGGTEINNKFYPDKMGQIKFFKSKVLHKGVAPKKDLARFNLNIVFKEK